MMVQPDAAAACFRIKRTQDVDIHARNLASWEQLLVCAERLTLPTAFLL